MRDSTIFYRSFYEAIKDLPKEHQADLYNAIFEYSLNFNEVELAGVSKSFFKLIKPQLDANNKRYENGKKGGKPNQDETKTEPNANQDESKSKPNKNNNVNVNNNENVNENNKDKPTVFSFYKSLISLGSETKLANEWLEVRKKKKAVNSETAFNGFKRELEKSGKKINEVLTICVEKSWSGFNAEWFVNQIGIKPTTTETHQPKIKRL